MMLCIIQANAQMSWGSAVTISTSPLNDSSNPQVVVDQYGNSTAAWVENGFIYSSFQPVNGSWGMPVAISATGASSPQLGIDSTGKVTAIWLSSNNTVQMVTLPLNGIWSAVSSISSSGATNPSLAVNGSGTVAAVWQRNNYIESITKIGGILSLVSIISPVTSSNPHVAIGANGTVVAVWQTILGTGAATVESARQTNGVWGSAVNILPAPSALSHNYPKVSVDANGNADVIWYRYLVSGKGYSNVFVYASSLPANSSSWSFPLQISDTGLGNPAQLFINIACDSSGNKIATWTIAYDGQSYNIESSTQSPSGTWLPFSTLGNTNDIFALSGSIATDPVGNVTAANMSFDGSSVNIQTAQTNASSLAGSVFWEAFATVSSGMNNGFPIIAAYNGPKN